ncbi:uncharacterized protein LOC124413953 isoform X1 [Diprion similis]|uniref:uncharacterized protein LOC124413953 isoform X1 n=1 Tax=Diprion similis TaxID=362088 RepID=UPI001EF863E4|nr:uncharacterized protein LOC124413953 isoform X1 [Diprion similis]
MLHDLLRRPQDEILKSNFQTVYKFLVIAYEHLQSGKKITENSHKEDRSGRENSSLEDGGDKDGDKRVFHTSSTSSTSDGLSLRLYRSTIIQSKINYDENYDAESLDDLFETTSVAASKLEEGKTTLSTTEWKKMESNSVTTEMTRDFGATGDFRSILPIHEEQVQQVSTTTLKNLDTIFDGSTRTKVTTQNDFGAGISITDNNFVAEITTVENNIEIGSTAMSDIENEAYSTEDNTGAVITNRVNSQSETTRKSIFETSITIENDPETEIQSTKNNSGFQNTTHVNSEFGDITENFSEPEITTEINYDSSIYGAIGSSESGIDYNNTETKITTTENNFSTQTTIMMNNFETKITTEKNNIRISTAAMNNSDAKLTTSESGVNAETKITTLRNDVEREISSKDNNFETGIEDFETEKILPSTEFSTVSQPSEEINGNPDDYRIISDRIQESLESTTVSSLHVAGTSDIPYSITSVENPSDTESVTKPEEGDKIAGNFGDQEAEPSFDSQTTTTIFHPSSTDPEILVGEAKKTQVILEIGDTLSPYNGITKSTEVGLVKIPGSKSVRKQFLVGTNYVSRIYNVNDNDVAIEEEGENEDSIDPKSSYNDPYNYATNFDSDHHHHHLPRYHRFDESLNSDEWKASRENYLSKNFPRQQIRVPVKRGGHNTNLEKLYRWFYRIGQEAENPDFARRGLVVRYKAKPEIRCKESAKVQRDR